MSGSTTLRRRRDSPAGINRAEEEKEFMELAERRHLVAEVEEPFSASHSPFFHSTRSHSASSEISTFNDLLWSGFGLKTTDADYLSEAEALKKMSFTEQQARKRMLALNLISHGLVVDDGKVTGNLQVADKYPILIQTFMLVAAGLGIKYWLQVYYNFEGYISLGDIGMVFTGLFFIQGIVFGSATSDLKAAQALPGKVVVILEEMEDHFMFKARKVMESEKLTLSYPQGLLMHWAERWKEYLYQQDEASYWHCELVLREIVLLAALWDSKGASVSKVPELVGKLRDPLSSAAFIHRAEYLPATHILLLFFVSTASILMMLVKFNSLTVMFGVTASVLTVIWFTLRLIKAIQNPFNINPNVTMAEKWMHGYMAPLQTFQLEEYVEKLSHRRADQLAREAVFFEMLSQRKDSPEPKTKSNKPKKAGDSD